jgi:hypothetical protein
MSIVQILPGVAALGFLVTLIALALKPTQAKLRSAWLVPASLSVLFFTWTMFTVLTEGPLAFWSEHTRNHWGNQIWFDLLLAGGIACSLLAARAKAQGMSMFVAGTGSVGLLAMFSRLLFLEERHDQIIK